MITFHVVSVEQVCVVKTIDGLVSYYDDANVAITATQANMGKSYGYFNDDLAI